MRREESPLAETSHLLASYLPALLIQRLAREPVPPAPRRALPAERTVAAAMFADISGYSKITEEMARQGARGVETLSGLLDAFFGRLIAVVLASGGDVAKFAGDALLAVWPARPEEEGAGQALRYAASCALQVREALHDKDIAPGVRLSLRVGLGVGEIVSAPVGGLRGRAELYLAGSAVTSAAAAEVLAPRGGIALSPEAKPLLAGQARIRPWQNGAGLLDAMEHPRGGRSSPPVRLSSAVVDAVRAFIPGVVLSRLDAGQGRFEAELRRVSVLFVHLWQLGPEDAGRAHQAFTAIQEELYRFEGAVHHLSVDDKGAALVAAFGLPPLAHEDDAARAVLAALGVRVALAELGLSTSVGVATGGVFCGSVGHESRREYALVGAAVVRAARLMQAAEGGVLCDGPTFEGARDRVKFDAPRPLSLKGQERPVPVYRPTARRRLAVAPGEAGHALVGRWREREVLRRVVSGLAESGAGAVIAIEADHGFGKSHLVDETVSRAREAGLSVLRGAADALESATPYYAWRRALATLLPMGGTGGDSMVLQAGLLQQISRDKDLLDLAPLLDAIVPMGVPESATTRQLTGEARASATRDLLLRLVSSMAGGRPLVIAIEDVHWMDSASWTLVLAALRRLRPLLLVMTLRPWEQAPAAWTQVQRAPGFQHLRLGPLAQDEVAALLCQQLDVDRIPKPVLELVHQRAGGHPQLSLELAYALRDAGVLLVEEGTCRLDAAGRDLAAVELPETVQGLVRSRIDQMPPQAQLVLKVASVIGRTFPLRLLERVFPVEADKPALRRSLEALARAALVSPVSGAAEPTWAFRDAITQQVAYKLMLSSQRQPLHLALARAYEELHPAERASYTALLAHHWREAGEPARALTWLERAGELAMAGGAWREAAGFYSEILRLADEAGRHARREGTALVPAAPQGPGVTGRARWERRLGLALVQSGSVSDGRQWIESALVRLGSPLPTGETLWLAILVRLASHLVVKALPGRPLSEAEAADRLEAITAYETLFEVLYFEQHPLQTFFCALQAVDLARRADRPAELARAEADLALAYAALPVPRRARAALGRARAAAERAGGGAALAWVRFVEGQTWIAVARWELALEALGRAAELQRELGDQRHLALSLLAVGFVHHQRGEDALALAAMDEVYQAGERSGDASFLAASLRGRAMVLMRQGRAHEALPQLERALGLLANASRATWIAVLGEQAVALWRTGRRDEALAAAREAAARAEGTRPTAINALSGYAGVAEVCIEALAAARESGERAGDQEAVQAARRLDTFARVYPVGRPVAGLRRGQLLWLRGRLRAAAATWRAALERAERLDMPYEAARIHLELGMRGPPSERGRHLEAAESALARLGGVTWERQLEEERTLPATPPPGKSRRP